MGKGEKMPIIRKVARNDCAGCQREGYCYFGVAFKSFPTLKRVVFDDVGFTSCWMVDKNKVKNDPSENQLQGSPVSVQSR